MTFTDCGAFVKKEWAPLAFANGVEWAEQRRGHKDRFDCLYNRGMANKALWHAGAVLCTFFPALSAFVLDPDYRKLRPPPKVLLPDVYVPLKKARVAEPQPPTTPYPRGTFYHGDPQEPPVTP